MGRMSLMDPSSSSLRRLTCPLLTTTSVKPLSNLLLTHRSQEPVTGSAFTQVRSAPMLRLARMPVLEMVALHWSARLSLAGGLSWVLLPGGLGVPLNYQECTSECHTSKTGLMPTKKSILDYLL